MDLSDALASFELPTTIESPRALDDAISNLVDALNPAEADLVSLLSTLAYAVHGILEVILTSREWRVSVSGMLCLLNRRSYRR